MYQSTKTYGHNLGLSVAFRQWKAESHCRHLHGYSLEVKLTFESKTLDINNWCVDYGGLKEVKQFLVDSFDHKTLVATDDPYIDKFEELHELEVIDMVTCPSTGCEAFAKIIYDFVEDWLTRKSKFSHARISSVEVREHGANSAIYSKMTS
jgi:6-pyruvoyltetrahydropterin/6-carboxytetrahydropterin synthase